jgi:hypothetical protein
MPRSSRSKTKSAHTMMPSSQKQDAIDKWLQKMLNAFPAKGQITPEEINDWHKDLGNFSLEAIDFAFEKHRTIAIFFPIYGQIIDLCLSYDPPDVLVKTNARCDATCQARHGKGYNENDMKWLFRRMQQIYAGGDTPDSEALLTELDSKRKGGAPEWRK